MGFAVIFLIFLADFIKQCTFNITTLSPLQMPQNLFVIAEREIGQLYHGAGNDQKLMKHIGKELLLKPTKLKIRDTLSASDF